MYITDHLESRHLELSRYSTISFNSEIVTFLLYNFSGQMIGYSTYRPKTLDKGKRNDPKLGRYYTYVTKSYPALWGLETYNYRSDILVITEGIFDAVRFHKYNIPAICVYSNNPKHLKAWFYCLPRTIVAICDGDKAGKMLAKFGDYSIILPINEDASSLPQTEFERIVQCLNGQVS